MKHVMIIDDSPFFRDLLSFGFNSTEDWSATPFETAEDALDFL